MGFGSNRPICNSATWYGFLLPRYNNLGGGRELNFFKNKSKYVLILKLAKWKCYGSNGQAQLKWDAIESKWRIKQITINIGFYNGSVPNPVSTSTPPSDLLEILL